MRLIIGAVVFFLALITFIFVYAHKDDERLHKECEAKGGVLVEARSPMSVCVKEVK